MKLLRPHISIHIRCIVAMRQLGEMWPEQVLSIHKNKTVLLKHLLNRLTELIGAERLQLDHQPALALRKKIFRNGVHVEYRPHSSDPEHLIWREKNAHRIKTQVRGDHGQFSDLALIRREKRRAKKLKKNPRTWQSKPMRSGKAKWPKRSFPKRKDNYGRL